jgi:hypothetical protein
MKILSAAILIASVSPAIAQLGKDASYFCITEFAGGAVYSGITKKWEGTTFRAGNRKFVLRLKFLRTYTGQSAYEYNVTVTEAGSNDVLQCYGDNSATVTVFAPSNELKCAVAPRIPLRFNLRNNRFLAAYLIGYVDGEDTNEGTVAFRTWGTPTIFGGTCTKID